MAFLNARLNAASESYPTSEAIAAIEELLSGDRLPRLRLVEGSA